MRSLALSLFTLVISLIDAKTFRIPDALLLSCFIVLVFLDLSRPAQFSFFFEHCLTACFWCAVFYFIYQYSGGLGWGDVKYAALLGYALGLEKSCIAFLFTAFSAIFIYGIGIGILGWKKSAKLPFAPFLSFGTLAAEFFKIGLRE
ncbi:MAG: A24 family peptidase [Treponema sp.]|jgi:prepilin signal peptidase PulO-like enzyme (type II secretory pathway)|nr:A24 family peptidase [Treponema sp.]